MKRFTKEHEWVEIVDGLAVIGISAHAAEELGDITFIELPETDDNFEKGDQIATVESVKAAEDIYAPISGQVKEVNSNLEDEPEKINESAESAGWIIKLQDYDQEQFESLMSQDEYKEYLSS